MYVCVGVYKKERKNDICKRKVFFLSLYLNVQKTTKDN